MLANIHNQSGYIRKQEAHLRATLGNVNCYEISREQVDNIHQSLKMKHPFILQEFTR